MLRAKFLLWLLLLCPFGAIKATPLLEVTALSSEYDLTEYLEILEDPTGELSFDQVSTFQKHLFKPLNEFPGIYNKLPKAVWLKFKVRNKISNERFLLGLGLLDLCEVYNSGAVYMRKSGMLQPYEERELSFGRYPYVSIEIFKGEATTIYIKAYNHAEVTIQNAANSRPYHKLKFFYYNKVEENFNNAQYFLGLHAGVILIMVLYNFVVFLFIRDRSYLLYISALIFYLFGSITLDGTAYEYFWGNYPLFNLVAVRIFLVIAWVFYLAFTQSYLNTKTRMPKWYWVFYVLMALQIIFLIANLSGYWNHTVLMVLIAMGILATFAVNTISLIQRYRPAVYYMIANAFLVMVCVLIALWGWGALQFNPLDYYLIQIGMTLQVVLFSAGLADRINIMRRKYETQEREHREMIERQNAELEMRVLQRTAELEDKNKTLQEQKREILVQNEELEQQNEEISTQKDLIEAQKNVLGKAYKDIKILKELGGKINSTLDITEIILIAYEGLSKVIEASTFGIGTVNWELNRVEIVGYYQNGQHLPDYVVSLSETDRLVAWSVLNNHDVYVNDYASEYEHITKQQLKAIDGSRDVPNSLIYIPLSVNDRVIGILLVQSDKKNAFTSNHYDLLKSMAEHVAVGIDHARAYAEVTRVNGELNTKNTQIIDSLRYAQTIQAAILADRDLFTQNFSEFFLLYRPRDLVSGDFYWMYKLENELLVSCVDCTGHGVPGAFMSMIGHALLNEIVAQKRITNPAEVLKLLHEGVRKALQQDKGKNDDGMDITLCKLSPAEEGATKLVFAGAKASIFYSIKGKVEELRGDRFSIGGIEHTKDRTFNNHELLLHQGDMIYLSTDGFFHQQNDQRVKFGKNMFKEMLDIIGPYDMPKQKQMLMEALNKHQGKQLQRDDITVLGLKI